MNYLMKNLILITLCLLVGSSSCSTSHIKTSSQEPEKTAEYWLNLGEDYYDGEKYEDAIEAYTKALEINPNYAEAYHGLGFAYDHSGMYCEAIEAFEQVIRLNPKDKLVKANAYYFMGKFYARVQSYQEAIDAFKVVIGLKPDYAEALYRLGRAYNGLDMYQEAIDAFNQSIKIKPDYAKAFYSLGIVYTKLEMYQEAIDDFNQSRKIDPLSVETKAFISGKVIGEDTGQGVPGVSIVAVGGNRRRYAMTNDKGIFVLGNITPSTYLVGFYTEDSPYLNGTFYKEVVVPKGEYVFNANHVLKLGGSVSGTVYDADGVTPMNRVTVVAKVLNPQPEWVDGYEAKYTDSNGKYLLRGFPDSDDCTVIVRVRGHGIITKKGIQITKGKTTENVNFIVKWDDITGINGYVKSTVDNKPIKGAKINLDDASYEQIGYAYTDEAGMYSIVGVPPGKYKKAVAFFPGGGGYITKTDILIEKGKSTTVNFEFDKPSPN